MSCHSRYYTRDCFTSYPEVARRRMTTPVVRPAQRIKPPTPNPLVPSTPERVKESPHPPNLSCSRSRGCETIPQTQKPPRAVSPEAACVSDHSCGQHMLPQPLLSPTAKESPNPPLTPRAAAPPAAAVGWPVLRPTHAPATALKTNGNSAPHKTAKTKSALILVASLQRRDGAAWAFRRPPRAAD